MKYFVTGITGFIGSHLKKKLDGEIYGLIRWSHKKEKINGFNPIYADLRDYHAIAKIIKDLQPDVIVNLGAITPVSLSFEKPFEFMEINLIGAMNLAEINRRYNKQLKKFVHASTPEVYGIQTEFPIKETAPLNPNSPYATSKAAFDMYLFYMARAFDFPVVLARHANTYGRKNQIHFVIEAIVTQMLNSGTVCLGDPNPIRDFMHIEDTTDFYKVLIEQGKPGEVYNAGWGKGHSIKEVAEMAKEVTEFKGEMVWNTIPSRPGKIDVIELDATKVKNEFDWIPKIKIKDGLKKVADYWREKYAGSSAS